MLRRMVLGGAAVLAMTAVAGAQTPAGGVSADAPPAGVVSANPLANRPTLPPAIQFLQRQGVKLTLLGTEGDFTGYLGESPNGRTQVFYVGPTGDRLVAGLLFDAEGQNRTGIQIGEMQRRFDVALKQMSVPKGDEASKPLSMDPAKDVGAAAQPPAVLQPPASPPVTPAAPPSGASTIAPVPPAAAPQPGASSITAPPPLPTPGPKTEQAAPGAASELTIPSNPAAAAQYISSLDRGAVERALKETAWFNVGVDTAPAIYMVADPQCPFCHAAWARLEPLVMARQIQVRVILIAGLKGSVPLAISILSRKQPGGAWLAGEGSRDGITIAPPPAEGQREYIDAARVLDLNAAFISQFGIVQTPTFLYFGKDERLYHNVGLPDDVLGFLGALK